MHHQNLQYEATDQIKIKNLGISNSPESHGTKINK